MATARKTSTTRPTKADVSRQDRAVVYRGITIQPMIGKRSAIAEAIREGFRTMNDTTRDAASKG